MFYCYFCKIVSDYRDNIVFIKVRNTICNTIDFFYPPFQKLMPIPTFRYLASGGSAFLLDIITYFISYNYILQKQDVVIGGLVISAPIFAWIISFFVVNPYGFLMSKFIVFQESNLKGRIQLFRYFVIVGVNIFLNYALMKLTVEILHFYPTISRIITAIVVAVFSFIINQKFTFGKSKNVKKTRISLK